MAARRPADDLRRLDGKLRQADLIVTARNADGLLSGLSRAITDFHYCTYLSDLAVDVACQRRGIGKQLISKTHELAGLQNALDFARGPLGSGILSAHWNGIARLLLVNPGRQIARNQKLSLTAGPKANVA